MAAVINLKVKSDFSGASADLKKFGDITEAERKKVEAFQKSFKDENIKAFNDRLTRSKAAVQATRGPLAAMTTEHRKLRAEIEKLIRKGLDPESDEVKLLATRYKKLDKEMEEVAKQSAKNKAAAKRMEGAMLAIGAGAVIMGKRLVDAFVDFSRESLQAASDAEEIEGKYEVVFRSIADNGEGMASSLASDFDLANSTAKELLGNTGDLLTGFGLTSASALDLSEKTNRLALDLASFTNAQGGAQAVSAALTKSYAGERESLKTYGIVLSEADVQTRILENSQKGLTFENEKAAKAYATLELATEQSKNAIGDYSRTADSAANVQRTLDEQIKRSKENWGAFLNEGITPVRKAFRDFLKETNDAIESESNISDAVLGRDADVAKALSDLKKIEVQQQAIFDAQASGSGDDFARVELRNTQKRIAQLQAEKDILDRINAAKLRGQMISDLEKKAADEAEARNKISLSAEERLEELRVSNLSSEEKQIELLNAEIDKWSEFSDIIGVNELLNSLIAERNELMNPEAEAESFVNLTFQANAYKNSMMDAQFAHRALTDEVLENNEAQKISYMQLASVALESLAKGFEDIGKAIVEGSLGIDDFGRLFLNMVAQTLSAIGSQLVALATVQLLLGNFAGAAVGYAEGAAAFLASGIVSAAAGSFEDGGFIPGTSYSGDNKTANVNSGEAVLNTSQQKNFMDIANGGSGGNSFPDTVTLVIDGTPFIARVQQGIDNRELTRGQGGAI